MKQFLLTLAVFCLAFTSIQAQRISTAIESDNSYAIKKNRIYDLPFTTSSSFASRGSDVCATATDISGLLGGEIGETQNSDIFDNTDATTGADDPATGFDCFQDSQTGPVLENTEWFSFVGDGSPYAIRTGDCGAANPMGGNDSQIALYAGDCDNLTPIACSEDENFPADIYNGLVNVETQAGVTYYVLVDGWNGTVGEYCVTVTKLDIVSCDNIAVGETTLEDEDGIFCFGEVVTITIADGTTLVTPPVGFSGFRWLVSTTDATGLANPFAVDGLLGAFGAQTTGVGLSFTNDPAVSNIPAGVYFFTPVVYSNGTIPPPPDNQFSNVTFEDGCVLGGPSVMVTLTSDPDVAELTVTSTVDIVFGDNNDTTGTATIAIEGGSGDNTILWSTGDTTLTVDSLAEGSYMVTITDPSPCVATAVRTIVVVFPSEEVNNEMCATAVNLDSLLGGPVGELQSSGIYDNTDAATDATDPTTGIDCWGEQTPTLHNTQWFSFVGDGNIYEIRTTGAGATPNDDTQIAIYTGNCDNLVPAACNEDVSGQDFNTIVSLITEADVTYYILVDGWDGTVGEYVVTFTQQEPFACADAVAPQGESPAQILCIGDTLMLNITQDFQLPAAAAGTLTEFRWVFAPQDISGSENPFADGFTDFIWFGPSGGTYNIGTFVYNGGNGNPVTPGTYFLTPIAYSGATATNPGSFSTYNFDNACFVTGNSIEIEMLPELAPLTVTPASTPETAGAADGTATVTVAGGSGGRSYAWNNGETTQEITGLAAGDYTVTVSDLTGCVEDVVVTVTVGVTSSVNDPALGAAVQLFPNPTTNAATFQYSFQTATDLQINVTNTLGQTMMTKQINNALQGRETLELSNLAPGTYFVRFGNEERQAVKPLVIIR